MDLLKLVVINAKSVGRNSDERKRSDNMPIEHRRVGDICDNCGDRLPESKNVSTWPENEPLLCQKCGDEETERKNKECSVCKKPVGDQHLSLFNGKEMCRPCIKKQDKKDKTREQRKSFLKRNTKFLIMVGLMIIGLVIAYIGLASS